MGNLASVKNAFSLLGEKVAVESDPEKLKVLAAKTMMNRNGEEEDLFGISVFLCSDANSYITGQTIFLDGGFTAQ
jgi:NAD(P)-dependent dehydrogenase (short-subunit alcohol dehydrogenase family)